MANRFSPIMGGGHRDPGLSGQSSPIQLLLDGGAEIPMARPAVPSFWVRVKLKGGKIQPASPAMGKLLAAHIDRAGFDFETVTEQLAKRQGFEAVTKKFGEGENRRLQETLKDFGGCRILVVQVEGGLEIWRHKDEIAKWSQKDEVNGSTAIRLAGTGSRKIRNAESMARRPSDSGQPESQPKSES